MLVDRAILICERYLKEELDKSKTALGNNGYILGESQRALRPKRLNSTGTEDHIQANKSIQPSLTSAPSEQRGELCSCICWNNKIQL